MGAVDLRPLGVGEILDLGIKIYRRRFGTLVRAVAVVVVPVAIVSALIQTSVAVDAQDSVDGGDAATALVATLLATVLGWIAAELASAASFEIVSGDYLDKSPTWQSSLRSAREKVRPLLWLSFLHILALIVGVIACFVGTVYLYVVLSVATPVLLFENVRGRKALSRSRALVRGRWWKTAAVLLLTTILTAIVRGGLTSVLLGITAAGDNEALRAVSSVIATSVGSMLTTPFAAAVIAVLYFDFRVRKDGFDLELLARQIGVEPPEDASTRFAPEPVHEAPPFWPPPPGWRPGGDPPPDA